MKVPKKKAYIVINNLGQPLFSARTFERAAEGAVALMRGAGQEIGHSGGPFYRIDCVEAD